MGWEYVPKTYALRYRSCAIRSKRTIGCASWWSLRSAATCTTIWTRRCSWWKRASRSRVPAFTEPRLYRRWAIYTRTISSTAIWRYRTGGKLVDVVGWILSIVRSPHLSAPLPFHLLFYELLPIRMTSSNTPTSTLTERLVSSTIHYPLAEVANIVRMLSKCRDVVVCWTEQEFQSKRRSPIANVFAHFCTKYACFDCCRA